MNILHTVESYYPAIGGMQEVVKQISEQLVKTGHSVTVATSFHADRMDSLINGVDIKQFRIQGNSVRGITGEQESYRKFLLNSKFDVITNFAAQQWATDIALTLLDKISAKKVFVPTGFSEFYNPNYQSYFNQLKDQIHLYDMNVFLSYDYRDINFARDSGIKKIMVIPNGASIEEFMNNQNINIRGKLGIPDESFLILQVGSFSGLKGQREAIEIYLKSNVKKSVLLMIGNNFENFRYKLSFYPKYYWLRFINLGKNKRTIIKYIPRKETVAAYKAADLFIFPSNVECSPIVLFECMAAKTPFLTTDVGNSKEIIEWSQGGMLLPTEIDKNGFSHARIPDSVKMLDDIYINIGLREQLAESGFKAWKENFTWEMIAQEYLNLYQNILNS